jgi:hypothetical protein
MNKNKEPLYVYVLIYDMWSIICTEDSNTQTSQTFHNFLRMLLSDI